MRAREPESIRAEENKCMREWEQESMNIVRAGWHENRSEGEQESISGCGHGSRSLSEHESAGA